METESGKPSYWDEIIGCEEARTFLGKISASTLNSMVEEGQISFLQRGKERRYTRRGIRDSLQKAQMVVRSKANGNLTRKKS